METSKPPLHFYKNVKGVAFETLQAKASSRQVASWFTSTFFSMTLQQLLPPPHLLTTRLQPKNRPQHEFLDWWVDHYVGIDTRVKTQLTGKDSLYEAYVDACLEQNLIPLSLRAFNKRFETLLEFNTLHAK
jgi:hypothetical protein